MLLNELFTPYSCLNCGSAQVSSTRICRQCFELLFIKFGQNKSQKFHEISCFYLLNWIPKASDTLSLLHRELKNTHPRIWKWFAQKAFAQLSQSENSNFLWKNSIAISIESGGENNHAESWGNAISEEFGIQHIVALKKIGDASKRKDQKSASAAERRFLQLELSVDLTKIERKPIIFVDDVLTTGATLKEAHRVLGFPNQFLGLIVSHRKLH